MVSLNYDKFGINRKVSPDEAKMPKKWLSFMNSDRNAARMERFGVVAIVRALQEFGGATKSSLVKAKAAEYEYFTDEDRESTYKSGKDKMDFNLQWAMSNLKKAGLLYSPQRGLWDLTESGEKIDLNDFDVWRDVYSISTPIWEENRAKKKQDNGSSTISEEIVDEDVVTESNDSELWREKLLSKLQAMNPYKFEELVVNLMRKIGIQMVTTSKSGDSGIDGIGYLRTPELMTYKIVLQTKRFGKGQVTGPDISNFAGTINGQNADRGIFVTTSGYTKDAVNRSRQGANLITLVNGDELVELLYENKMGVSDKQIVVINDKMFPTE
ncbi:restriction endonuclease [Lactobacillus plantarum]|nr:restriction endonuclease [Lactiplantibacillus plantarum]